MVPFVSFEGEVSVKRFVAAAIGPYFIMGLLPFLGSLFTGNLALFCFSVPFTFAASGDFIIISKLLKSWKGTLTCTVDAVFRIRGGYKKLRYPKKVLLKTM